MYCSVFVQVLIISQGGAKKLTWSERQALAKKQVEEEEAHSKAASFQPTPAPSITRSFGGVPPPPPVAAAQPQDEEEEEYAPPVLLCFSYSHR